jgi:hypothetical protein
MAFAETPLWGLRSLVTVYLDRSFKGCGIWIALHSGIRGMAFALWLVLSTPVA